MGVNLPRFQGIQAADNLEDFPEAVAAGNDLFLILILVFHGFLVELQKEHVFFLEEPLFSSRIFYGVPVLLAHMAADGAGYKIHGEREPVDRLIKDNLPAKAGPGVREADRDSRQKSGSSSGSHTVYAAHENDKQQTQIYHVPGGGTVYGIHEDFHEDPENGHFRPDDKRLSGAQKADGPLHKRYLFRDVGCLKLGE